MQRITNWILPLSQGVEGANVFTKADVNGPNARPTYKYLKEKGVLGDVAWNFAGKFLVDKDGNGNLRSSSVTNSYHLEYCFAVLTTNLSCSIVLTAVLPVKSEKDLEAQIMLLAGK
jgi:hypothetical protein